MTITTKKQILAIFDFDGTMTTKDTMFDFIIFCHGKLKLAQGLCFLFPILILYKLGFISNSIAKQKFLSFFFKGNRDDYFSQKCQEYISRINTIIRSKAVAKLKWRQEQGHIVLIDSASVDKWIYPWAKNIGIDVVIATKLEVKDGFLTGNLASENCYGQEKVNRLLELFPDIETYQIYVYGDSNGDRELLKIADHPFYRKFE